MLANDGPGRERGVESNTAVESLSMVRERKACVCVCEVQSKSDDPNIYVLCSESILFVEPRHSGGKGDGEREEDVESTILN